MDIIGHNADIYNRHVQNYVDKFMDLGSYAQTFQSLIKALPPGASVLELGCGPGNVIAHLYQQRPDLEITGIDLSPEMIAVAKQHNMNARFLTMDLRKAENLNKIFDAVVAAFSLPYLTVDDLPGFFSLLEKLTTHHGWVYLSCMEGSSDRSGFEKTSFTGSDQLHISYFGREEIERGLKQHGFTFVAFETGEYLEPDGSTTIDLFYTARK
jgi:cyclopropane fatty-acyl-phospholipid synthase-like methyltransferase